MTCLLFAFLRADIRNNDSPVTVDNIGFIPYNIEDEGREDCTMDEFQVIFYDAPNGTLPARDFLDGLDKKMRAKMLHTIAILQEFGVETRPPYSEHLEDGIFELRAKQGSDISRVLYFFFVGKKIILTNGFIKKTQQTPPREIELAKKCRSEYLSRKENQQ